MAGRIDHDGVQPGGFENCFQLQGSPQMPLTSGRISDMALLDPLPADCFLSAQANDEQLPLVKDVFVLCLGGSFLDHAGNDERGHAGGEVIRCQGLEIDEFEPVIEGVPWCRGPGLADAVQIDDGMRDQLRSEQITQRIDGGRLACPHSPVHKDGRALKSHVAHPSPAHSYSVLSKDGRRPCHRALPDRGRQPPRAAQCGDAYRRSGAVVVRIA